MEKLTFQALDDDFQKVDSYFNQLADEYRQNISGEVVREKAKKYVAEILDEFNMNKNWCGYQYQMESVLLYLETPLPGFKMMGIYSILAEKHHKNKTAIEHDMRNLLEYTWDHGNREAMIRYFGNDYQRPNNKAFIVRIAEEVKLRLNRLYTFC